MLPASAVNRFSSLVLEAIDDEAAWRKVLETLMAATGARVGVMSLRDPKSAELSFPANASMTLEAPLIVGIDAEHVSSYFERYAALDVWTAIEEEHYPHRPYFMSEYLPLSELEATEFFKGWLRPQKLHECLIAEVHCSPRHWVALNLLFDRSAFRRHQEILDEVEKLLPILRRGWAVRERLTNASMRGMAASGYLENVAVPCLVLEDDFTIIAANTLAIREFGRHAPLAAPFSVHAPLGLRPCALRASLEAAAAGASAGQNSEKVPSLTNGHSLHVSRIMFQEDFVGRRRSQFVVLVKSDDRMKSHAPQPRIWENPKLTTAQAAVVRWVAEGGVVPDFASQKGIAKKTAYDHLLAARRKLDGIAARDIYTSHQALLAMER